MTQQEWKARLAIVTAFANGEEIQYYYWGSWHTCKDLDFAHPSEGYRIKPKPLSYRPWKSEEVPVGCQLRRKEYPKTRIICLGTTGGAISYPIFNGENTMISLDVMLSTLEHSIDQGKTWLPCGVSI